jgi:hypothetical protein
LHFFLPAAFCISGIMVSMNQSHGYYGGGWQQMKKEEDNDAPEVALTNYPVAVRPDGEGLQHVQESEARDEKEYRREGVAIVDESAQKDTARRRRWLWITGAVVLCLVGFGVGIGVGIVVGRDDS